LKPCLPNKKRKRVWGTICNRYWDKMDASVFCKSIGFATGFPYYKDSIKIQTGRIYEPNLHCNGDESSLLDCAHEGWKVANSVDPCSSHEKDATVHCYQNIFTTYPCIIAILVLQVLNQFYNFFQFKL
jgi:hypothetical protein